MKTLRQSDKLNAGHPADIAFLSMTLHSLDQSDEARQELSRFEHTVHEVPWADDPQTLRFLQETRKTLDAAK